MPDTLIIISKSIIIEDTAVIEHYCIIQRPAPRQPHALELLNIFKKTKGSGLGYLPGKAGLAETPGKLLSAHQWMREIDKIMQPKAVGGGSFDEGITFLD